MKKLLNSLDFFVRVFFVVIAFSVASSFAEMNSKNDTALKAVDDLQASLSQEFSFCDVYYNESLDRIVIRVAVDGLDDLVGALIEAGYDETFEGWAEYRSNIITLYDNLLECLQAKYRNDLTMSFHLVSDVDKSRDFISINGGTKSVFDILKFQSTIRQKQ